MMNIISQETIKPSSPTPPHLNRYNLSFVDNKIPIFHRVPWVFFYKNYNDGDIDKLKKSMSKCLTQYYPFAGRLPSPSASYIECNDEGVMFFEASIDAPIQDFFLKRDHDMETITKLIPNNYYNNSMLAVQLSHFSCGGVAVAVSITHKIADGITKANLVNHWATVTRGGSPINNPTFVSSPIRSDTNLDVQDDVLHSVVMTNASKDKYTHKRFVFSNSKLGDLKNKINDTAGGGLTPTRVEALASLLFKCAVNAATAKKAAAGEGGSFRHHQPSKLSVVVNMRDYISGGGVSLKYAVGNIIDLAIAKVGADDDEIQLNEVISRLRKDRLEIQGTARDLEEVGEMFLKKRTALRQDQTHRAYSCTSLCNSLMYKVDFGWGKPERVILPTNKIEGSSYFVLMDTASGDGIEAAVILKEDEMALFQNDKEFLAFVQQH